MKVSWKNRIGKGGRILSFLSVALCALYMIRARKEVR